MAKEPALKTPKEWGEILGWVVMDPDGWRHDGKSFDEPITEEEYTERMWISTVMKVKSA